MKTNIDPEKMGYIKDTCVVTLEELKDVFDERLPNNSGFCNRQCDDCTVFGSPERVQILCSTETHNQCRIIKLKQLLREILEHLPEEDES